MLTEEVTGVVRTWFVEMPWTPYLCSPSLDSIPFQIYAKIAQSLVRLEPSLVYPV